MVYWKYLGLEEVNGGTVAQDNVENLLEKLLLNKGKIRVEEYIREDNNLCLWVYRFDISLENGEKMWLLCQSRRVFENIYDSVKKFNNTKIYTDGIVSC